MRIIYPAVQISHAGAVLINANDEIAIPAIQLRFFGVGMIG